MGEKYSDGSWKSDDKAEGKEEMCVFAKENLSEVTRILKSNSQAAPQPTRPATQQPSQQPTRQPTQQPPQRPSHQPSQRPTHHPPTTRPTQPSVVQTAGPPKQEKQELRTKMMRDEAEKRRQNYMTNNPLPPTVPEMEALNRRFEAWGNLYPADKAILF